MSKEGRPRPVGQERRRFGRRTMFKPGRILENGWRERSCTVVDLSEAGARLVVPDSANLPGEFELVIEQDDFSVRCEVVHRRGSQVGARFVASPRRLSWGPAKRPIVLGDIVRKLGLSER